MVIGIAGGLVASALNVGDLDDLFDIGALLLAAEGLSNAVIAERLGASRQSVSEWRKRFFEQGVAGLEERPRPGRPRSFFGASRVSVGDPESRFRSMQPFSDCGGG
jgi:hypothetical protein